MHRQLPRRAFVFLCLLVFVVSVSGQSDEDPFSKTPDGLVPSDTQVRELLRAGLKDAGVGQFDQAQAKYEEAVTTADKKGLPADVALCESWLGQLLFVRGRWQEARTHLLRAQKLAAEVGNPSIEANVLTLLSLRAKVDNDFSAAIDLLSQARDKARAAHDLRTESYVGGELGSVQRDAGQIQQAKSSIEAAIKIDEFNHFDSLSMHLVYLGQCLSVDHHASSEEVISLLQRARDTAIKDANYAALVLSTTELVKKYIAVGQPKVASDLVNSLVEGTVFGDDTSKQEHLKTAMRLPVLEFAMLTARVDIAKKAGDKELEQKLLQEGYDSTARAGFQEAHAAICYELALNLIAQKKDEQAVKFLQETVGTLQPSNMSNRIIDAEIQLADTLLRLKRFDEAHSSYATLQNLGQENGNLLLRFRAAVYTVRTSFLGEKYLRAADEAVGAQAALKALEPLSKETDASIAKDRLDLFVLGAAANEKLERFTEELPLLTKAVNASIETSHQETWQWLLPNLRTVVDKVGGREGAEKAQKEGHYIKALEIYESMTALEAAEAAWAGKPITSNGMKSWFDEMVDAATRLTGTSDGVVKLRDHVRYGFGSVKPFVRTYDSLILRTYLKKQDFRAANVIGKELLPFLPLSKGKAQGVDATDLCLIALASLFAGDAPRALTLAKQCEEISQDLPNNAELLKQAYALEAQASRTTNPSEAAAILEKLVGGSDEAGLQLDLGRVNAQAGKKSEAMAAFRHSLELSSRSNDNVQAAQARVEIAELLDVNNPEQRKEKTTNLENARDLLKNSNAYQLLSKILVELAKIAVAENRQNDAELLLDQAISEAKKSSQQRDLAGALGLVALAFEQMKQFDRAADSALQSAALYSSPEDQRPRAWALMAAGRSLRSQKKPDEAIQKFNEALSACTDHCDWRTRYWTYRLLASCYTAKGEYYLAIENGQRARSLSIDEKDETFTAMASLYGYWTLGVVGDWEQALRNVNAALLTFQKLGDKQSQFHAFEALITVYGDRRSEVKNLQKALEAYQSALELARSDSSLDIEGLSDDLVEVYSQLGRFDEALQSLEKRIKHYEQDKDEEGLAHSLIGIAEIYRKMGNLALAEQCLLRAKPMVVQVADTYATGRFQYAKANLAVSQGRLAEARDQYITLLNTIEGIRNSATDVQQQKMSESYDFIYDELIDVLFKLSITPSEDSAKEALEVAERNKAKQFSKTWGQRFAEELRRQVNPELLERERLATKSDNGSVSQASLQAGSNGNLSPALSAVVSELRTQYPQYASVRYPSGFSFGEIPLHENETFIEFKVADDTTFAWIGRHTDRKNKIVKFYAVPRGRAWLAQQVKRLRQPFDSGTPQLISSQIIEDLFNTLFPDDVREIVLSSSSLVVIPDDSLFLVPLEMLSPSATEGIFPLAAVPTRYYPSLDAMSVARTNTVSRTSGLFGMSDPITPVDERLPSTKVELERIASLFADPSKIRIYSATEATKSRLLKTDLTTFRFLHFATHGRVIRRNGIEEPALVLSEAKGSESGKLWMSDILQLKLGADMVVLSACSTGYGSVSRAEGVFNLGRAFLTAGARSTVVSLWPVADESTADLMSQFYRNIVDGKSTSEALAAARESVIKKKETANPFFWAPFILMGE